MEALEAQKPVERELAMKAVHFSKRMRWLDTSVVFTGLFWVFVYSLYCFWNVGWDSISSANKWHRVPVPDCKALMFIDVVCLCGPATHSSWRSLMDHIISHQSISTCPHWNQGGKRHWTCYWLETAFAFHVFWLFELNRPGQEKQARSPGAAWGTLQWLHSKHCSRGFSSILFIKIKYKINKYIYTYVIYI